MDEESRAALLAFAASAYSLRSVPPVEDWGAVLATCRYHGLVPLANRLLQRSSCAEEVRRAFRMCAMAQAARSAYLEQQLAGVLSELRLRDTPTIVLKGPALARLVYSDRWLRPFGDLDLLVPEDRWSTTREVLLHLGFRCLQPLVAPPPKVWDCKAYYHTQYDRDEDGVRVEVHYDSWWYGLRPRLRELFWQRAVPVDIEGVPSLALSPEDQIVQLSVHLQHHGFSRLIWFTDLALLVQGGALDWSYLVWAAHQEGLSTPVFFSLEYLRRLLGVDLPQTAMAQLRPGPVVRWLHERLWPPSSLLSLRICDRVLCDLNEVPEGRELLLNLALTGRRWEKLWYVLRLLVPPREWLAYYYGVRDPAVLVHRRLVHAPRILLGLAADIGRALRDGAPRLPV